MKLPTAANAENARFCSSGRPADSKSSNRGESISLCIGARTTGGPTIGWVRAERNATTRRETRSRGRGQETRSGGTPAGHAGRSSRTRSSSRTSSGFAELDSWLVDWKANPDGERPNEMQCRNATRTCLIDHPGSARRHALQIDRGPRETVVVLAPTLGAGPGRGQQPRVHAGRPVR